MRENRFQIIKEIYINEWNIEWPVQIIKGALTKDTESESLLLQLKLVNISNKNIKSVYIDIYSFDDAGDPIVSQNNKISFLYQDVNVNPRMSFGNGQGIKLDSINTRKVKIELTKVVYSDDIVEKFDKDELIKYKTTTQISNYGKELKEELERVYEQYNVDSSLKVAYIPEVVENSYWICCCGVYNEVKQTICRACTRDKDLQLKVLNKQYLEESRRNFLKDSEILRIEEEKQHKFEEANKNRKRKLISKISIVSAISLLAIISIFYIGTRANIQKYENNTKQTIDAGESSTIAIKEDGTVLFAGSKTGGKNSVESWKDVIEVATSLYYSIGLKSDGTLLYAGDNLSVEEEIAGLKNIVKIAVSQFNIIALDSDGRVHYVKVKQNNGKFDVSKWSGIIDVATDGIDLYGVKSDGTVVTTGNRSNQINKSFKDISTWTDIIQIECGMNHIVGLKSDGTIIEAGISREGIINREEWKNIVQVDAGHNSTVGLRSDGSVVVSSTNDNFDIYEVKRWDSIVQVKVGNNHIVGLKSDGTIVSTGENKYGQCDVTKWSDIKIIE